MSYSCYPWVTLYFATNGRFLQGPLFCTIFDIFRCKKGPPLYFRNQRNKCEWCVFIFKSFESDLVTKNGAEKIDKNECGWEVFEPVAPNFHLAVGGLTSVGGVGGAISLEANFEVAEGGEVSWCWESEGAEFEVELGLRPRGLVSVTHLLAHVDVLSV